MARRAASWAAVTLLVMVAPCAGVSAAPRTDIVVLINGDHITGEIVHLERGQLEFKTDDIGTLQIEWDNVSRLEAARVFEVTTTDGRRFLGILAPAAHRTLAVAGPGDPVVLALEEVTQIAPIGRSFWRRLDGSIDAGFNYTQSSGIAQLNINSSTLYRRPRFEGRLDISLSATRQDNDEGRDDRGSLELSYTRYRWTRWFVGAAGRFETNESLGVRLRSQVGLAVGPRIVNTNRAQLAAGLGLVVNEERAVEADSARNVEALLMLRASYFTYDRPKTNLDLSLQYYPSLSNTGRHRLQLDAGAKREVWKDFFVALNLFDSFDNRPPSAGFDTNDVGIVVSLGWTY